MQKIFSKSCYIIPILTFFLISSIVYAETLIPKSSIIRHKCGACHKATANGAIEVIEETRKTSEDLLINVFIFILYYHLCAG